MRQVTVRDGLAAVVLALALIASNVHSTPVKPEQLPEAVEATFKAAFPNAKIQKLDVEEEEGVMVYDFEFHAGDRDKETDIAGNGTMLESTLVIPKNKIPAAALKGMDAFSKGAKFGRCEWIEMSYDIQAGEVLKRDKPLIKYAAELTKGGQWGEVIVAEDGAVLETPQWAAKKSAKAPPPAK